MPFKQYSGASGDIDNLKVWDYAKTDFSDRFDEGITPVPGADILGTNGDDYLWGGADNDTLNGEGGEDRLYGGDGDDRLIGWHSHDTMTGGAGAAMFVIHPDPTLSWTGDAPGVITDFTPGPDRIDLHSFAIAGADALADLLDPEGGDTWVRLSAVGGRDLQLEGVNILSLDAADFIL